MPKPKQKGELAWLGRTTLGNLNIVGDSTGIHVARSVRRAPRSTTSRSSRPLKGTPWNHTLGVLGTKKEKRERFRLPAILEATEAPVNQKPGDEAASDPPSSVVQGDGGAEMSVSGSLGLSASSDELMPDPGSSAPTSMAPAGNQASRVEGEVHLEEDGLVRRVWDAEEEFPTEPSGFGNEELMATLRRSTTPWTRSSMKHLVEPLRQDLRSFLRRTWGS